MNNHYKHTCTTLILLFVQKVTLVVMILPFPEHVKNSFFFFVSSHGLTFLSPDVHVSNMQVCLVEIAFLKRVSNQPCTVPFVVSFQTNAFIKRARTTCV